MGSEMCIRDSFKRGRRLAPLEQGLLGRRKNRGLSSTRAVCSSAASEACNPMLAKQALQGTEALFNGGSRDAEAKVTHGHVAEICRRVLLEAGVNGDSPSTTMSHRAATLRAMAAGVMHQAGLPRWPRPCC